MLELCGAGESLNASSTFFYLNFKPPRILIRYIFNRAFLLLPLGAIIYLLLAGYTPLFAAFWGINVSVLLSWLNLHNK